MSHRDDANTGARSSEAGDRGLPPTSSDPLSARASSRRPGEGGARDARLVGLRLWQLYLLAGIVLSLLYFLVPPFRGSGPLFNLVGISSAVAIVAGTRLHRPGARLPWYLFALGQVLFVAGDVIYYTYPHVFHTDVPFPSVADAFYLGVYPCLIAGLLLLIRHRNPGRDRASMIDASIIATGLGLLSWVFLMAPYARDPSLSVFAKLIAIGYPLMDVLLLMVCVRLTVASGSRTPAFYMLVLSIVSLLTVDSIYGLIELNADYETGALLDAGWLAYYFLWAAAALHPSMRTLSEPLPETETRLTKRRLVLLAAASLLAPALQLAQASRGIVSDVSVIAVGAACLFLLVVGRMAGLLRKNEQAISREETLRGAGAVLVAATTRERIYEAALEAASELVGTDHSVRVCIQANGEPPHMSVAAAGGDAGASGAVGSTLPQLPRWVLEQLRERRSVEMDSTDARLRERLGVPRHLEKLFLTPLLVQEQLGGVLVVASASGLPRLLTDALDALASQVALALESARLTEVLHRRKSEARFRSLVQNSSDVILILDPDSTIRYLSPSVVSVLGYRQTDLLDRKLSDIIHPGDKARFVELLEGQSLGPRNHHVIEFRMRRNDGDWIHAETAMTNLLEDPNVGGIVLNTRDISERHAIDRMKSEFISVVSHELRTPLTAMRGALGLLAGGVLGTLPENGRRMLDIAVSSADRLARLLDDVLDLEKMESGQAVMNREPCSAAALVQQAADAMAAMATEARMTVTLEATEVPVLADSDRIQQALTNLISNAVKFSPPEGHIRVTAVRRDGEILFSVSDEGRGIPKEKLDVIFDRFQQVDASDSRQKGGTGLGLTISRSIVESHGGVMWVESSPGKGSTFYFTLPALRSLEQATSDR